MKTPLGTDTSTVGDHKVEDKVIITKIKTITEATTTTTITAENLDTDKARDAEIKTTEGAVPEGNIYEPMATARILEVIAIRRLRVTKTQSTL